MRFPFLGRQPAVQQPPPVNAPPAVQQQSPAQEDQGTTTTTSPVNALLSAFTENAKEINSFLGFPGVLLLVAVLVLGLFSVPGYNLESLHAVIVASVALAGSIATYSSQRYVAAKRAEAQTHILTGYGGLLLEKYFSSKQEIGAENIEWAINHIIKELVREQTLPALRE